MSASYTLEEVRNAAFAAFVLGAIAGSVAAAMLHALYSFLIR